MTIDCRGCGKDFRTRDPLVIYCGTCVTEKMILATHFTPGNVILSDYWREYDLVLAFHPSTSENGWSVSVIHCDVHGTAKAGEHLRHHCTYPSKKDKVVGNIYNP